MENNIKKIKRTIDIYPIFSALSADLIFFIPIDTLFYTLAKGLNASQITAMTMISLLVCILSKKIILNIVKKIGNINSLRIGSLLLLLSAIILTFAKSFIVILFYRCAYEISFMFINMVLIVLKNDLNFLGQKDDYYKIRNKAKVLYATTTLITSLLSGVLFNINMYLPMYLSIILCGIVAKMSFKICESKLNNEKENETIENKNKIKINVFSTIFLIIISNTIFYSIIKLGQGNSKLFMQYDFQQFVSIEEVTYCITIIVFLSRIARLIGNIVFAKIYIKVKDNISVILSYFLSLAFLLLILGHFLNLEYIYKVIIMSLGFFFILAVRDSFRIYIEDIALKITKKDEQQKILLNIEVYRKIGTLLLSALVTLILMKFELIMIEILLLILAVIEIFINKKLLKRLEDNN